MWACTISILFFRTSLESSRALLASREFRKGSVVMFSLAVSFSSPTRDEFGLSAKYTSCPRPARPLTRPAKWRSPPPRDWAELIWRIFNWERLRCQIGNALLNRMYTRTLTVIHIKPRIPTRASRVRWKPPASESLRQTPVFVYLLFIRVSKRNRGGLRCLLTVWVSSLIFKEKAFQ
jgi:hypothetical protein